MNDMSLLRDFEELNKGQEPQALGCFEPFTEIIDPWQDHGERERTTLMHSFPHRYCIIH
jgi:hypothetical protein